MYQDFVSYLRAGNDTKIKQYNRQDLRDALAYLSHAKDLPVYNAIKNRLSDIEQNNAEVKRLKEKWIDRLWGFGVGLVTGILLVLFSKIFLGE